MPKTLSQENRREFPRIDVELKATYRLRDAEKNDGCAEIQNLSHGGLMFISSFPMNKGDLLDMTIYYQEFEIPFNAKVVWREQLKDILPAEFKYGVKYRTISILNQSSLSLIIGSEPHKE